MNGFAYSDVGTATANVGYFPIDIAIAGPGKLLQKIHCGHDLARLAVSALGNVFFYPGLLYRVQFFCGRSQAFDGGD
jgi:hypothetical protein